MTGEGDGEGKRSMRVTEFAEGPRSIGNAPGNCGIGGEVLELAV